MISISDKNIFNIFDNVEMNSKILAKMELKIANI